MVSTVENDGFYDAARARQISMGQSGGSNDVLVEINDLQLLVSTAASSGELELIASSTTMGTSAVYFAAWNDPYNNDTAADKLARAKMAAIVNYFSRLGYSIKRSRIGITDAFEWTITW